MKNNKIWSYLSWPFWKVPTHQVSKLYPKVGWNFWKTWAIQNKHSSGLNQKLTKVCFYKLFANSVTRWVFLCSKIIFNAANQYKFSMILFRIMENWGFDMILLFEMILQHRKTHWVVEIAKKLHIKNTL